jgi:hypothetical protein
MKVLIACEESGAVRDAFAMRGHQVMSCDLQATSSPGMHYQGDVRDILYLDWDLIIAHPPCTHLSSSGAAWFKERMKSGEMFEGRDFFLLFTDLPSPKVAIENPVGIMSKFYRKPDQIIQPWQFGHGETKATCLWLKGLPLLKPTDIVQGREQRLHNLGPSPDRGKLRSKTFQGIADAMADQWGDNSNEQK